MIDKYDSTDFWYTFLNSLYNFGLSGIGESEIDEEMQEKLLSYFKMKIEEGVSDGVTALPPGLHDYFWRFPEEMLPKLRALAEGFLATDPENAAATIILAIVACAENDSEYQSHIETVMRLVPKDPCMNLIVINEYRKSHDFFGNIEWREKVLIALENLYAWAKEEGETVNYQDAKFAYWRHGITPYTVYKHLKNDLKFHKELFENSAHFMGSTGKIEKYNGLVKKCIDLILKEQAAFQKKMDQESENQQNLVDATSDNTDIWDAYLNSLENRGHSSPRRKLTQKDQEQLLAYFKTKIEEGVVDGKTTLPSELPEHISHFPEAMHLELREFTEEVIKRQPENGAAAKMLAIIVWEDKRISGGEKDSDLSFLEQAMVLAHNDAEIYFFAISQYDEHYDPLFRLTFTALERLFERAKQQGESELYGWLAKIYKEVGRTPCHIYRNLMKNSIGNAELIARCKPLIDQMQQAFQQRLTHESDDWYALRGLGDIYETLGETELAQKFPWEGHSDLQTVWEQEAWVGRKLPDFSAVAIDGTPISYSDYHGKMVLLNFCAKWCGFCASEIPYIKEVYDNHRKDGFDVIGVSLDENETDLREFIEEHDIPWLQIYDGKGWDSELARYFGINSVPSQWLIDRDGKILSVSTRREQLEQLLKWIEITRVGNVVPDFSAADVDGNPVSLSAFRGKVVLLYFGYMHQEPELTYIDTLYHKYHKKGFEVICVNVSGCVDAEALRNIVREKNHQGKYIYADHDGQQAPLAHQFGLGWSALVRKVELPAVILIDTNGEMIEAGNGKVHAPEVWAERLEKLVAAHLGLC